jgi:hypothetical protein
MSVPKVAGWRSSYYGTQGNGHGQTDPAYFVCVSQSEANKYPGSKAGGIYVLGGIGTSETNMPFSKPPGSANIANVFYDTTGDWGPNPEPFLNAFDAAGMEIILQVEPGKADISQLATMILNNFKNHPCIVGFGVDVEWWNSSGNSNSNPIPVSIVNSLVNAVHAINPLYKVVIKHYDSSVLPSGISGVTYLLDGCGYNNFSEAVLDYVNWAQTFSSPNTDIGYQMLYVSIGGDCLPNDHNWWGSLNNPEVQLISAVYASVPTAKVYCSYIVDFSLLLTYPTCTNVSMTCSFNYIQS